MYRPRSRRAGVTLKVRLLRARTLGPINGRQPIVKVMPNKSTATITSTVVLTVFCQRRAIIPPVRAEPRNKIQTKCGEVPFYYLVHITVNTVSTDTTAVGHD